MAAKGHDPANQTHANADEAQSSRAPARPAAALVPSAQYVFTPLMVST